MKKLVAIVLIALTLVGCGSKPSKEKDLEKIVIGATALPHAEYLKLIADPLKDLGYELDIKVFDDYILPNKALDDGSLDANFFQHTPYLLDFNASNGTKLTPIIKVHYEPIAIYGGTKNDLKTVADKDIVLIPDDPTNLPRGLKVLEELGWIELNDNRATATLKDITKYNVNIEIKLAAAGNLPKLLDTAAYAVINGNYALAGNITDRGLQAEKIDDATIANIANVIAVRTGEESSDKTKAILEALKDPAVVKAIAEKYAPAAISVLGE